MRILIFSHSASRNQSQWLLYICYIVYFYIAYNTHNFSIVQLQTFWKPYFVTEREERERLEQEQREEEEREYQERLRKLEEQERKQRARQQEIEERERRREEERRGQTEEKPKVEKELSLLLKSFLFY